MEKKIEQNDFIESLTKLVSFSVGHEWETYDLSLFKGNHVYIDKETKRYLNMQDINSKPYLFINYKGIDEVKTGWVLVLNPSRDVDINNAVFDEDLEIYLDYYHWYKRLRTVSVVKIKHGLIRYEYDYKEDYAYVVFKSEDVYNKFLEYINTATMDIMLDSIKGEDYGFTIEI